MAEEMKKKLHIAIFTNNYLPNPYGVSTSIESFRKKLTEDGHTVYVFAPHWRGEHASDDQEANIFRYPSIDVPTKIHFSVVVPYAPKIDAILEELQIDVIHAQHPNLLGTVAKKWAKKKKVPLVFTWHTLYDQYAHYMPFVPQDISGKMAISTAVAFADACDRVIVPTPTIRRVIKNSGVTHDRISVVPSGVDAELFSDPHGDVIRKKYSIRDAETVLVTVSRLTEEKNVLFLARAVARVLQKNENTVFLCGGEGDLMDDMRKIFEEHAVDARVIFAGKVAREDVKHYLDAGDIFVYASTSETQGTIVTENMYVGRPIVAVGQNGVGDLVENGITGIAVTEDEEKFAAAVHELIDDKTKRAHMAQQAYERVQEKYTTAVCTQKLLAVYHEAISFHKRQ